MKISFIRFSHAVCLVKSGRQFVFEILCIQDIVYYTLSGSSGTINMIHFLYQICWTGISMFRTLRTLSNIDDRDIFLKIELLPEKP